MGIPAAATATLTIPAGDRANFVASGSIASAVVSGIWPMYGAYNLTISGTWTGSIRAERSFDGGSTWFVKTVDTAGTGAVYTANVSVTLTEIEEGVMYRLNLTALDSGGPVDFRVSTSGRAALTFGVTTVG